MKHSLRVESPCHADWGAMAGTTRKRHCGECRLDVYNFSEMTQREVDRVLELAKKRAAKHADARLCARFVQREDGSIVTKPCPTGFRANLLRARALTSAALATLISFVPGLARATTTSSAGSPVSAAMALVQIKGATRPGVIEVVDPSGGVIPKATLRFTNEKTGAVLSEVADRDGAVKMDAIPPATYKIETTFLGFATSTIEHVALPASLGIRIKLQIATMGEIVELTTTEPEPPTTTLSTKLEEPKQDAAPAVDGIVQVMSPDSYPMGFLQITLVNNATNQHFFFVTDTHGIAHVRDIPSGVYRIGLYDGVSDENLSEVQFPWTTPVRATYRLVERGGPAWLTEFPELDVQPQRPEIALQEPNSGAAAMPRRSFEEPVAPAIDPNAEMETPLGMASLSLHVGGLGLKPGTETVTVVVTNDETHAVATGTPDASGQIRFVGLPEGMYTIAVSAPQRGTTTLHQRLPSMLPVHAFLSFRVDPNAEPMMGAVMMTPAKTQKKK